MRALREQPRLTVAKALALCCLLGVGIAIGVLVGDGGTKATARPQPTVDRRLAAAQHDLAQERTTVSELQAQRDSATTSQAETQRALSTVRQQRDRLQLQLHVARRALHRLQRRRR
jgi:septal ring factor EnvC (AmiA/AmiB activator)